MREEAKGNREKGKGERLPPLQCARQRPFLFPVPCCLFPFPFSLFPYTYPPPPITAVPCMPGRIFSLRAMAMRAS